MRIAGAGNIFQSLMATLIVAITLMVGFSEKLLAGDTDPFAVLRGKWGGNGTMVLSDGSKDRLVCKAQYSGTANQLRLVIGCKSSSNNINMKARLSANGGRLLGVWEEETFKALGTIAGRLDENKITFYIGGNVTGNMVVRYSKSRQKISIKTRGVALQDISMTLRRR